MLRNPVPTGVVNMHMLLQASVSTMLPSSHCSPCSTTPLRQTGGQSLSLLLLAPTPAGQQPSLCAGIVIAGNVHAAVHVPMLASTLRVQAMPSSHAVGQRPAPTRIAVSQVSPGSTTPLPQPTMQSLSVKGVAPAGQQADRTDAEFHVIKGLDERSRCFLVKQGHASTVCQLNLRGMDDALAVISASTDNIEILHQVLDRKARFQHVAPGELAPEQWLQDFYDHRKGSGKGPVRPQSDSGARRYAGADA